jgi:hypothetical protein
MFARRWRREWNWDLTFSRLNDAAKYTKEILWEILWGWADK